MAGKKSKPGSGCGCFFVLVLVIGSFVLLSNLFGIGTIQNYGFSQYISNIKHFHFDHSFKTKRSFPVYRGVINLATADDTNIITTIDAGRIFKFMGHRKTDYSTWVAIQVYDDTKPIYGYINIPEQLRISTFWSFLGKFIGQSDPIDNAYFSEVSQSELNSFRDKLEAKLMNLLTSKVGIKVADTENLQLIEDDDRFKILDFLPSDKKYYCNAGDYDTALGFYNMYIGENYEINLYQLNPNYQPIANLNTFI